MISIRKITYRFLITILIGIFPIFVQPVIAADDVPFLSLDNTNLVVLIAFLAFIAILLYLKVPAKITDLLDNRQQSIKDEIDGATSILEESKSLLADLEREHKFNIAKAETILSDAEIEAKRFLTDSKKEIRMAIERKIKLAEEQIKASEELVIKSIKDKSIDKAIETAEIQLVQSTNSNLRNTILKDSLKDLDSGLKQLNL